jgi:hypothetical protein
MSTNLQGAKLNYPSIDKQAYVVYKEVKHFRSYILKNHTKVIMPHPAVLIPIHSTGDGGEKGKLDGSCPRI